MQLYSKTIAGLLGREGIFADLFDYFRVVGPDGEESSELADALVRNGNMELKRTGRPDVRVKNEGGLERLIVSVPVVIGGSAAALELVRDVTVSQAGPKRAPVPQRPQITGEPDNLLDKLTGLNNRDYLTQRLPSAVESALKYGKPLSCAILELDYFHKIVEVLDSTVGDFILCSVAETILMFVRRETDIAVRYSGEQFLVCFPGVDLESCLEICRRICRQIEGSDFQFGGRSIQMTVSVGIASSQPDRPLGARELVSCAVEMLQKAKLSGRNQIVFH